MPDVLQSVWEVMVDHPVLSLGAVLIAAVYVTVMGAGPRSR